MLFQCRIQIHYSCKVDSIDFKEQIRTEMFTIKQKMSELRQLHGKAALTSFDDSDSNEAQIEVLTQEITRLFKRSESRLQQFTSGPAESDADDKVSNITQTFSLSLELKYPSYSCYVS